jgi:hypothetical protein
MNPEAEFFTNGFKAGPSTATVKALEETLETFDKWLYLEDRHLPLVVLGAIASNYMAGGPEWLLIVGGPGTGKTEVLNSVSLLPNVHPAATITEAALLSGTPKRERDDKSSGGFLREIGEFGILILKDFTSVLSMHYDKRMPLLAALREIYDGSWTRRLGVDGGRVLHWQGKLGLVGGCTSVIDSHHAVMAQMGERFLLYRLPDPDPMKQGRKAMDHFGQEEALQHELAESVRKLFATITITDQADEITDAERDWLVALAAIVARARSGVDRDGRTREIETILDPEAPARVALALRRLLAGLDWLGVERETGWEIIRKVAFDCITKTRRAVIDHLRADPDILHETTAVAVAVRYPTSTARRALEDLAVHGLCERQKGGNSDSWRLSAWTKEMLAYAVPEKSPPPIYADGNRQTPLINTQTHKDDFSGTLACDECGAVLGDDPYIDSEGRYVCQRHYEDRLAAIGTVGQKEASS